ncbi:hypothetical protein [Microbacterium sp. SLBN-111]|uniref:hypothetical protein n=1 Tax=Microbacterium sp. SLBN-111 TaxID=3377733 RepID=UPI003C73A2F0
MSVVQRDAWVTVGRAGIVPDLPVRASHRRTAAKPVSLAPIRGAARAEIIRRVAASTTAYLVDRSGSMYGAWGDPSDVCGAACESVLGLQRRSGGGRAVIVPWGSTAPAELVVGPIDVRTGEKKLTTALREHGSLGGNDMSAALRRLAEVADSGADGERIATFLITDGIETVTDEIREGVRALPDRSVHLCLIDRRGGCGPDLEAQWRTVEFGSFTRFAKLDVGSVAREMAALYAGALGLPPS